MSFCCSISLHCPIFLECLTRPEIPGSKNCKTSLVITELGVEVDPIVWIASQTIRYQVTLPPAVEQFLCFAAQQQWVAYDEVLACKITVEDEPFADLAPLLEQYPMDPVPVSTLARAKMEMSLLCTQSISNETFQSAYSLFFPKLPDLWSTPILSLEMFQEIRTDEMTDETKERPSVKSFKELGISFEELLRCSKDLDSTIGERIGQLSLQRFSAVHQAMNEEKTRRGLKSNEKLDLVEIQKSVQQLLKTQLFEVQSMFVLAANWLETHPMPGLSKAGIRERFVHNMSPSLQDLFEEKLNKTERFRNEGLGGILGDQMGVGKTLEMLAFLVSACSQIAQTSILPEYKTKSTSAPSVIFSAKPTWLSGSSSSTLDSNATFSDMYIKTRISNSRIKGPSLIIVAKSTGLTWKEECAKHLSTKALKYIFYEEYCEQMARAMKKSVAEIEMELDLLDYDVIIVKRETIRKQFRNVAEHLAQFMLCEEGSTFQEMAQKLTPNELKGHTKRLYTETMRRLMAQEEDEWNSGSLFYSFTTLLQTKSWKEIHAPLYGLRWARVIMDEAHEIRNANAQMSQAIIALRKKCGWLMTGTPFQNSFQDYYSLFAFLRIPFCDTEHGFRALFPFQASVEKKTLNYRSEQKQQSEEKEKDPVLTASMDLFLLILQHYTIRRLLLEVPESTESVENIDLTLQENQIVQWLEDHLKQNYRDVLDGNPVKKKKNTGPLRSMSACALQLILRLQQVCLHPMLAKEGFRDMIKRNQLRLEVAPDGKSVLFSNPPEAKQRTPKFPNNSTPVLEQKEVEEAAEEGADIHNVFVQTYSFSNTPVDVAKMANARLQFHQRPCTRCKQPLCLEEKKEHTFRPFHLKTRTVSYARFHPSTITFPQCGHAFCPDCVAKEYGEEFGPHEHKQDNDEEIATDFEQLETGHIRCLCCDVTTDSAHYCCWGESLNAYSVIEQAEIIANKLVVKKKKNEPANYQPLTDKDLVVQLDRLEQLFPDDNIEHSSKTRVVVNELRKDLQQSPTSRVLLFCKSAVFLHKILLPLIMKDPYLAEHFQPLYFHGGLTVPQREQVLQSFRTNPRARILLATIDSGGVGLNLQEANVIYLLDYWWNPQKEEQAIGRVRRTGQKQQIKIKRFLVRGSIEGRIYAIQKWKKEKSDKLLQSVTHNENQKEAGVVLRLVSEMFKEEARNRRSS